MKTKIIADSSCDILMIPGVDFTAVPLSIHTAERAFQDDAELDVGGMLDYLAGYSGRSYTTCPNIDVWLNAYAGGDEIYVVTLSSNISGTCGAALSAAKLYREEHPDAKIHIFDTLSAGPEVRMLAEKIAGDVQAGKSFEEICRAGEAYMRSTRIFFALQSFHNFAENGRVSKAVAKIGGLLGIRIMATASAQGTIEIIDKCRGDKATLKKFLEHMEKANYRGGRIFLANCQNPEFAKLLSGEVQKLYPDAQVTIYETRGLCSFYAEKGGILVGFETE